MTSNYIDRTGLVVQSLADIVTELETGFKTIYSPDINLDPNSPDSQMINLFAQAKIDILDLINSVYNSFSPSNAAGVVLDQRCAINGVIRKGATYTTVYCTITTDRALSLIGIASNTGTPFTISDPSGNEFYLQSDTTLINGTNANLLFIAANAGAIEIVPSTITNIVTQTLGVLTVTNPSGANTKGVDEESDPALRYRRSISVSLPSQGYLDGLIASLLAIDNVNDAIAYENNTSVTSADNIPPHSIAVYVDYIGLSGATGATGATGVTGSQSAIANAIYTKRNAGCGMTGTTTEVVLQPNNLYFDVKFSYANYQPLYVAVLIALPDPVNHPLTNDRKAFYKAEIASKFLLGINDMADFSEITSIIKAADPNVVVASGGFANVESPAQYEPFLYPDKIGNRWVVSESNITILQYIPT